MKEKVTTMKEKVMGVGVSDAPKGVMVVIGDTFLVLGPLGARHIAQQLLNAAELVEAAGGADPEIQAVDRAGTPADLRRAFAAHAGIRLPLRAVARERRKRS